MVKKLAELFAFTAILISGAGMLADGQWKDGILFTQEKIASLQGHDA